MVNVSEGTFEYPKNHFPGKKLLSTINFRAAKSSFGVLIAPVIVLVLGPIKFCPPSPMRVNDTV
jgi:hypothetical protein